jgi:hypothetical protein
VRSSLITCFDVEVEETEKGRVVASSVVAMPTLQKSQSGAVYCTVDSLPAAMSTLKPKSGAA